MKIKDKILIIEDETSISSFIATVLAANNYDTMIAHTGSEAITMITHLYEVIDGLMLQLVDTSNEVASTLEEIPDLLDELDEVVLDDLLANGADPDGLWLLLAQESEEQ